MSESVIAILISGLSTLAAILAPVFTALINKHLELKKIKIQEFFKKKLDIFQELMMSFGNYAQDTTNLNCERTFSVALNKSLLVCSESLQKELVYVLESVQSHDPEKAIASFKNIIGLISIEVDFNRQSTLKSK